MQIRQPEDDKIYIQTADNGWTPLVVNSRQDGEELHLSIEASTVNHISVENIKRSLAFGVSGQSRLVLYIPKNITLKAAEGAGYSIYTHGLVEFANEDEFFQTQDYMNGSLDGLQNQIESIQGQLRNYREEALYQSYGTATLDSWYEQETEGLYSRLKDLRIRHLRMQLPQDTDLQVQNDAVRVLSQLCDLEKKRDLLNIQESMEFRAYSQEGAISEYVYMQRHEEIQAQLEEINPQIETLQKQLDAYIYNYTLPEESASSQTSSVPGADPADPANPASSAVPAA